MKIESPNTLRYAAKSGLWRTHRNIKDKLNNAFSNLITSFLYSPANETRQFQVLRTDDDVLSSRKWCTEKLFMHLEAILIRNLICFCCYCLQGCAKMMSEIGNPVPGLWNDKTWESKVYWRVLPNQMDECNYKQFHLPNE
jgi:hypothetical protein